MLGIVLRLLGVALIVAAAAIAFGPSAALGLGGIALLVAGNEADK